MSAFWVSDRVKVKMATRQMSHASHQAIENATRCVTQMLTTSRKGKVLVFKSKALSFYIKDFSYINIFL